MNAWDDGRWFPSEPKKPPPEHGIKMKKAGTTWWGRLWIEALENVLRGQAGRLSRGRTYARAGRTHDLVCACGLVTARVTGSRPEPYEVRIELKPLRDAQWDAVIAAMAAKAQFAAELLRGEMPQRIGDVFGECGVNLFPATRAELKTSCSCPDWGDPCKHVAATHYVLGEAFDRDPFLLFELRGRTKEQVLGSLRAARTAGEEPEAPSRRPGRARRRDARAPAPDPSPALPHGTRIEDVSAADYDRPRGALPALHVSFDAPVTGGALLRQLGVPASWSGDVDPAELLGPLVRAAAEKARRIALAEPEVAPETPPPAKKRRRR